PSKIDAFFLEQFANGDFGKWVKSEATKKEDGKEEESRYTGIWKILEPLAEPYFKGDHGLVLSTAAAHHAISVPFEHPLVIKDKPLVVQYEVKFQNSLECGGAYIKLISQADAAFDPTQFNDKTPYTIMFGPDRCGSSNKVHFILRHRNPKTGEVTEKHLTNPPAAMIGQTTVLYTLIVNPDNSFEIRINNRAVRNGNLLTDMDPPINPPAEIDDPNDRMPDDWVLESQIPDPKATKPADWDENAPKRIPNVKAEKPADWLDNEPLEIPDPEDVMPEEWDEDEDGDYEPRMIANPKCQKASGCGKWERPMMENPAYKGKWSAPMIANPAYKGVWAPRKIANPDYFEDKQPAIGMTPIVGAGFELWTIQDQILFDNIYVGQSVDQAEALAAEAWVPKHEVEEAKLAKEKAAAAGNDEVMPDPRDFVNFARYQYRQFVKDATRLVEAARQDIGKAIADQPRVAGIIGMLFVAMAWIL
ncbi:Calreticulin family-domain-containing protein, partial [Dimargaris cristalligena]